jgi:hypothetical protein
MGGVELMNEVELKIMSDKEIMERQSKLIDDQRRLFKATVENFKNDVIYLKGCVRVLIDMCDDTDPIVNGLPHVINYISEMESMLNDFEYRMKDYE